MSDIFYEQWKNGACLGYVIMAMERLGNNPECIQDVVSEIKELFEFVSVDDADRHYCGSKY